MTIAKLHKHLGKLIADGYGRKTVCIHKTTFTHALESDGAVFLPVCSLELHRHEMLNDDGGRKELANGQAVERTALVLYGEDHDDAAQKKEG